MDRRIAAAMLAAGMAGAVAATVAGAAAAQGVAFDGSWQEQRFRLFGGNAYVQKGSALDIGSDGTVSLIWTALPRSAWNATAASWTWQVDASVPPTDLTAKGGDDRNVAVYFVFLPEAQADDVRGAGIRSLLRNDAARVLVYTWGGDHPAGAMLPSPYLGPRGRTVVLRGAGTGRASERVDLAADYARAFGGAAPGVVGLAVSADSDDTDSRIRARLSDVSLH